MAWPTPQLIAWIERIENSAPRATMFQLLDVPTAADTKTVETAFLRVAAGAHPDLHRHTLQPPDAERLVRAYGKVAAAYDTLRDAKSRNLYRKEIAERGASSRPPLIAGAQPEPRTSTSSLPPFGTRASTTGSLRARTTTSPSVARTTTPPSVARTTTTTNAPRTTTPPSAVRTTTPPSAASRLAPGTRQPLITAAPTAAARTATSSSPPPSPPSMPPSSSRPPRSPTPGGSAGGGGARAQVYFRKAQSCLGRGDLGGALFNLRLAAAADPSSSMIRVALGEVQSALAPQKR